MYKNKLALWMRNTDTRQNIYAFFDPDRPVYAMQVKTGHYKILGYVALNRTHQIEGRISFSSNGKPVSISRSFEAVAKSQIYIGDFRGHATYDGMMMEWNIDSVTNNFAGTTLEFRQEYPNLGSLPVTSIHELQSATEVVHLH